MQKRNPPRSATEAKAPRRELDLNKERLIFCLTSLIGHRVTAKLRGNVIYEGVFHGCALEGDSSITLKHARSLPSEHAKSGVVIETLVIPGKDFLQVNAMDVPNPEGLDDGSGAAMEAGAFATDGEIAAKRGLPQEDRDLVAWAAGEGDTAGAGGLGEGDSSQLAGQGAWDAEAMFKANEKYGVVSTYNEDLYTTKLDPSSISLEKREQAERIAKEIENGVSHGDVEEHCDDDDDEEARFSAVTGTGAYKKGGSTGSSAAAGKGKGKSDAIEVAGGAQGLTIPIAKAGAGDPAGKQSGDAAADYRRQRGMIIAHSPMHSSISEMKRINALNLEPAVPKLDDKTGNDWINFKQVQSRNKTNPTQGDGLKREFQDALSVIQKRTNQKQQGQEQGQSDASGSRRPETQITPGGSAKPFTFSANAKEFTFSPTAASFTPGGSSAPAASPAESAPAPVAKSSGPAFNTFGTNPENLKLKLDDILETFAKRSGGGAPSSDVSWGEATGPSFHEILGQPNPMMPMSLGNPGMPGQWQQQQQQQGMQMRAPQGQAPGGPGQMGPPGGQQMMQGQMMMQNAPGGQQQMFQPMYPAPSQQPGQPPMQPPGGQMPPQGQPGGQQMVMMPSQPGGQQMVQGGQNQGGMPKFGGMPQGMVMMVPAGGMPQGQPGMMMPMPMQGQPGQPGQQGQPGPQGNPQMMQRPMYQGQGQQMGGGPPPHQMQGDQH